MTIENYRFTEEHEWVYVENNIAIVGISKHAIDELGEIVYVELPQVNAALSQGDEFGTIESVKTVSSLYAPISGDVLEINEDLSDRPNTVSESPLLDGWLIKLKNYDTNEYNDLMTAEEYEQFRETLD